MQAYHIATPIAILQKQWSFREYRLRLAWIDEQWNKPDKQSYENARIAQRVLQAAVTAEHRNSITLEDQLVQFEFRDPATSSQPTVKLPELKLMDLPSDHILVVGAKMAWNARMRPPPSPKKKKKKTP